MASMQAGGITERLTVTATAAGTTTFTVTSTQLQVFTGSTTQTVVLPAATTMFVGQKFEIYNQSTGILTLQFNGGAAFTDAFGTAYGSILPHTSLTVKLQTSGTSAGTWAVSAAASGGISAWVTATPYIVGQVVTYETNTYMAQTAHTSAATFAADVATAKWILLNNSIVSQNIMLTGNNFESGLVDGWTATGVASLTNGLPVSVGSGGNPFSSSNGGQTKGANTSNPAVVSSGQIAGAYSLNLATTGAGTIGDGYISQAYPIDIKFQAKVLSFSFSYKVVTGSPNMSGTSSNTYAVAIYDVTNNAWLGTAGIFNFIQSSGVGTCSGTFQTASTTAKLQIFVYSPVAPAAASALYLDDFYIGPQTSASAPAMSDWTSFTPTGAWVSNTTYTGFWKRVGDSAQIYVKVLCSGAPTSAALTVNLPSGLTIDATKFTETNSNRELTGSSGTASDTGVNVYKAMVGYNSTTSVVLTYIATGNSGIIGQITQAAPFTFGSTDYVEFSYQVPIVGWSSNSVMSNDTDTRVVAARYTSSTTAVTTGATSTVIFPTIDFDTHGAYNSSTGVFTVPISGKYRVSSSIYSSSTGTLVVTQEFFTNAKLTGSASKSPRTGEWVAQATTAQALGIAGGAVILNCQAGDSLVLEFQNGGNNTITMDGNANRNWITIERLSGPAVIAVSETVACKYQNTAGTSITSSAATVPFATKIYDTHLAFNGSTGVFTAPVSGKYRINYSLFTAGITQSTSQFFSTNFLVTSTPESLSAATESVSSMPGTGASENFSENASRTYWFNAGDIVAVQASSTVTGTLSATAGRNIICIERVGN